jgi:hypothetical protein
LDSLRDVSNAAVKDSALKFVAESTAARFAQPGRGYGDMEWALSTAKDLVDALAKIERPDPSKPVTAALLKRLAEDRRLPKLPPWT